MYNYYTCTDAFERVNHRSETNRDRTRNPSRRDTYGCVFNHWNRCIEIGGGSGIDTMSYFRKNNIFDNTADRPNALGSYGYNAISENTLVGNLEIYNYHADSTIVCNNVVSTSTNRDFFCSENPNSIYNNLLIGTSNLHFTYWYGHMFSNTFSTEHSRCIANPYYDLLAYAYNNIFCSAEELMPYGWNHCHVRL